MKTADQLFEDIIQAIGLPVGNAVVLRETTPTANDEPNWVVAAGDLPDDAKERYENAVIEMRKRHPRVDWDLIKDRDGQWRTIKAIKKA
ncbi:MAG TPA: hypothetical protein VFA81_10245 [Burkholderiales bacterium]|nr:hypothetical protein [Burkholderiales bacterium]